MAQIPTLCEVSYDSEWLADDYFYTPFRLPSADFGKHPKTFSPQFFYPRPSQNLSGKNDVLSEFEEKNRETTQHNTYFEYLRDYYIENSSSPLTYFQSSPRNRGGTVASPQLPSRSHLTIPARFYPTFDGCISPIVHHDHNKLPRSLPAVSRSAQYPDAEHPTTERNNLVWIDTLKSWVPMKKYEEGKPYLSFVNNPPYVEKHITVTEALDRKDRIEAANKNEKRSRKAYSTPLYDPNKHTCRLMKYNPLSARATINLRNNPTPVSRSDEPTEETVEEVFGKDTHEEKVTEIVPVVKAPFVNHNIKTYTEVETVSVCCEIMRPLYKRDSQVVCVDSNLDAIKTVVQGITSVSVIVKQGNYKEQYELSCQIFICMKYYYI
ncbi:uncharacterized protein LOC126810842 isoform X4 [Patella vulgata]|uniref:uncharacterized protein LOC126810842 isoform X4 n=1 Tax=Patella vulgata TaxID=6465 RepID=UPI0024A7F9B5|nr:uncharacterized protein LOC126810842 isoform X4 [Patella vulgata]